MAVEPISLDICVEFGDSRSNGSRDIRGADCVLNERTNMTEGYHIRQKRLAFRLKTQVHTNNYITNSHVGPATLNSVVQPTTKFVNLGFSLASSPKFRFIFFSFPKFGMINVLVL